MTAISRLHLTQQLYLALVDYWHDVDTNWGRNAADYYTEDALFEAPLASYSGREGVREFYRWREGRGARVAVHAINNFRIEEVDDREVVSTWYLSLYAGDGEPPLPTHAPIQISLMQDRYIREGDRWLVAHRLFKPLFEGGTAPTNPALGREGAV